MSTCNSDCSLNVCVTEAARAFEMAINIYTDMVGEIDHTKNMLNFLTKL